MQLALCARRRDVMFVEADDSCSKRPQEALNNAAAYGAMSSDDLGSKFSGAGFALPDLAAELADETASVIEIAGAIKWFDVSKGYGFIIPDNGSPDVLLHVTCLRRDGYQTAYEGARVVCEVLQRPKRLQAFRILWMDGWTGVHAGRVPGRSD